MGIIIILNVFFTSNKDGNYLLLITFELADSFVLWLSISHFPTLFIICNVGHCSKLNIAVFLRFQFKKKTLICKQGFL